LAAIAMKRFDFEKAERLFRRAIDLGENGVVPKYSLAMVLLRLGRNREAISLLKSAVRSEVRSPALYQALGVAYAFAGDRSRAELHFRTALALAPNMPEAVHGLSRILIDEGKASTALQLLSQYLEQTPNDDPARELLARAYDGIGQHRSAAQQLISVFNRLPEDSEDAAVLNHKAHLASAIGTYFGFDRKEEESELWLLRAIKLAPRQAALPYQNLGRLYIRTDRDVEAFRLLSQCRKLFPRDQDTYILLSRVYENQGLYDEGIHVLEPLIKAGTANASVYSTLGCMLEYRRESSRAVMVLKEGHEKYPDDYTIIHNLAYVLLMSGEAVEGRRILETYQRILNEATNEEPDYEPVLTATWGLVYMLEGKIEVGIQFYKQAAKLAARLGNRQLAGAVMQKMHLEVAKLFLNQSDYASARREIDAGLLVKRGREPVRRELKQLRASVERLQ
jgi:tetratricopeptide (TPR) repeat protein